MRPAILFVLLMPCILSFGQGSTFVHLNVQDDYLNYRGKGTDRYYTGGMFFGITCRNSKTPGITESYSISQKVFTPENFSSPVAHPDDYPYAGLLYLSYSRNQFSLDGLSCTGFQIDAGVTGEESGAEQVINTIHTLIRYRSCTGWERQADMGLLLQVGLNYSRNIVSRKMLKLNISGDGRFGTVFNYLEIAPEIIIGHSDGNYNPYTLNVMPPLKYKKVGMYFFASPAFRYVLSNQILSDGMNDKYDFPGQYDRAIRRFVCSSVFGLTFFTNRISVNIAQHHNSKEFKNAKRHAYGEIGVMYRF